MTQARAQATQVSVDASTITDPAKFTQVRGCAEPVVRRLGHLLSISENYPDLKSNQNFLALQSQLEGTENRIEIARRDYNTAVQDYNTELVTIPGSLWAATMYKILQAGARRSSASAAAQSAPVVSFDTRRPDARAAAPAGASRPRHKPDDDFSRRSFAFFCPADAAALAGGADISRR